MTQKMAFQAASQCYYAINYKKVSFPGVFHSCCQEVRSIAKVKPVLYPACAKQIPPEEEVFGSEIQWKVNTVGSQEGIQEACPPHHRSFSSCSVTDPWKQAGSLQGLRCLVWSGVPGSRAL